MRINPFNGIPEDFQKLPEWRTMQEAFQDRMKEELREAGLTPRLYEGCIPVDVMAFIAKEPVKCEECHWTWWELCTNPDHWFIGYDSPISFMWASESRCPWCWFDPLHRTKYKCGACTGTGIIT